MSGMYLSVEVNNSNFMIPRGIGLLTQGRLARHQDIFQICTHFRRRGVASMLLEGTPEPYFVNAMQSATAFVMELRRTPDEVKVTSFSRPLQDAVSIGDWEAAREIASLSRTTWNADYEYEDDFLYVRFWHHLLLDAPTSDLEANLARFEEVLGAGADVRLDVCRALHARDEGGFESRLRDLLNDRKEKVDDLIGRGAITEETGSWVQHFALEGVALLKLAERAGLHPGLGFLHCPDIARGESPFVHDPNAWQLPDYVPRRK
jgi:Immunity protein 49